MPKLFKASSRGQEPIEITSEEYINSCGIFDNDEYAYRNLIQQELKIGTKCQKRIIGEFDTEVTCGTLDGYDRWNLTDEVGWNWIDHEITQEDLDFLSTFLEGIHMSANGIFRIKR